MTKVSFYLLPAIQQQARLRFACRLAEKAYREGHDVYLHTESTKQQLQLDELLWHFRAQSFVPHDIGAADSGGAAVCIGCGADPGPHHDVMINLALDIPAFFSRFHRVSEIVTEDDEIKSAKRDSFRFYRERGYPSETHRIPTLR